MRLRTTLKTTLSALDPMVTQFAFWSVAVGVVLKDLLQLDVAGRMAMMVGAFSLAGILVWTFAMLLCEVVPLTEWEVTRYQARLEREKCAPDEEAITVRSREAAN